MRKIKQRIFLLVALALVSCKGNTVSILTMPSSSNRLEFGVEKLKNVLSEMDYTVNQADLNVHELSDLDTKTVIIIENDDSMLHAIADILQITLPDSIGKEGYLVATRNHTTLVYGKDPTGALYGCYETIDFLKEQKKFPEQIADAPEMVLRGVCVGLQKPYYLSGRTVYEYPYTPETFPWFYDKELWIKYLDMLVDNRMNSLYLWNGHPFASLVKLEDYPFAVEVDEETFRKNEEIFSFLTHEADKRGIFVIQMFYNILVSKPFAEHYGIATQDRNRSIVPYIADYTRKSIASFIEKYPNVGLLVCLGEAMATHEDDVEWFTETIIPGVKDGLAALGRIDEPPLLLRAHDTDCKMVMEKALPLYKNLYTMHKYNGESLTTYEPRGPWTQIHQDLSVLGSVHIDNVHILANLEPFRYGSPDFIQKSVQAMHNAHGANALHLYPQASYWDWPYTADKLPDGGRLEQLDRDRIWYKTWARYAWKADRPRSEEIEYWTTQLGDFYGCGKDASGILEAYEQTGEIAPKLLRRFGITEGNRQTLLLGMFMSQLVNPYKYTIYPGFYESCGPEGEKLIEYVEKKWKNEPHTGELPPDIVTQVIEHGDKAAKAVEKSEKSVTKNKDEFSRLKNDVLCYREFAYYFNTRVKAAEYVLDYKYSHNIAYLEKAVPLMEQSLEHYKKLADLTKDTYLYANSMQTSQRRIPVGGDDGKYKHWAELVPLYEQELKNFRENIELLKSGKQNTATAIREAEPAHVKVLTPNFQWVAASKGKKPITGINASIVEVAQELHKMRILRINAEKQRQEGTTLEFETKKPVKLLVGFFRTDQRAYAKAPTLETDASANLYGQAEPVLMNAVNLSGQPAVNIHAYSFPAGKHTVSLPRGILLVLGFTTSDIASRNVGLTDEQSAENMDWLFY